MQKVANSVRGWAEVTVTGAYPEQFLNQCAHQGVGFWQVTLRDPHTLTLRVAAWDKGRIEDMAQRARCEIAHTRTGGLPSLLYRMRRRYGLLVGLVLSVATVAILSRFVLTIEVGGNVAVPTGEILAQLRRQGVTAGVFGPGLDTREICHGVMLEIPELSWMTINLHGTLAEVLVREGAPKPDIMEEDRPASIVATLGGIVTHVEATRGQALVSVGDTVAPGDTLISGWVDFVEPEGSTVDWGGILVRAGGRVEARVWHTLVAELPLEGELKTYTGGETTRYSLEFFGHTINFYGKGGISFPKYDKIRKTSTLTLPGGRQLPVGITTQQIRPYETVVSSVDLAQGETLLMAQLERRLTQLVGKGKILRTDYLTEQGNGMLTVTLLAECSQEIGTIVESKEGTT